ncbi:MAG: ABC transporter permease subunit [Planctomycetota bacterium]
MQYFFRRFLLIIPTFLGATLIVFTILDKVPGGPVEREIMKLQGAGGGGEGGSGATKDIQVNDKLIQEIRKRYNLDKPVYQRYLLWLWALMHLDLGESWTSQKPVWYEIKKRLPISISLGLIGFFLTYSICIPLGVLKAIHHYTPFDTFSSIIVFLGFAIPGWALGSVLLVMLGGGTFDFQLFPLRNWFPDDWEQRTSFGQFIGIIHHCTLPIFCYMLGSFATTTMLMKNSLMENLGQDYVRTAFAKGLPGKRVIFLHALRNSMIPLCTGLGHIFSLVLAGSFLIEKVFNIDGMGLLGYTSLVERNYPVAVGILTITMLLQLIGNIFSDFLYTLVDPRIKFK